MTVVCRPLQKTDATVTLRLPGGGARTRHSRVVPDPDTTCAPAEPEHEPREPPMGRGERPDDKDRDKSLWILRLSVAVLGGLAGLLELVKAVLS